MDDLVATLFGLSLVLCVGGLYVGAAALTLCAPVAVIGFWIWAIADSAQLANRDDRILWVIIVVALGPLGALAYWVARPSRPPSTA